MDNSKIQVITQIESDEDLENAMMAYHIEDFVNALKEIINFDPSMEDILEKHDILKFFT